ncbi:hypothetical protein VTN00DRAFT_5308 [Thermoascus crustaceus]|uniref:uncharacterized protein n=1 Tax=Thermoascus crustaceus TaxID=5088 RepID=UPI0037422E12
MGLSKSKRILILLIVDTAFFLLELIVGYAVHSLALVADSFHMLNDVLSLCVGLWAVKVANQQTTSKMYTYGWQRAETLGALVNGVFLVALCVSIFLEAIQRFVEPQEVQSPKLVCIVGCFGLLSNILGLVLFHEHSHGEGPSAQGHSHGAKQDQLDSMEQGYGQPGQETDAMTDRRGGTVASTMPENHVGLGRPEGDETRSRTFTKSDETSSTVAESGGSPFSRKRHSQGKHRRDSRRISGSSRIFGGIDSIPSHPATMRQEIIAASRFEEPHSESETESQDETEHPSERSKLLRHKDRVANYTDEDETTSRKQREPSDDDLHSTHNHAQPRQQGDKPSGHTHGDLNMRGVFLHVMGDALGNIGVIISALVIWLTNWSWRYYVDPGISLIITVIILCSAIPLCKAASRILLQAVPAGMSIDHIKEDIERLPGVVSSHHLHVWQLSDTKLVASLHIQVDCEIKGEGSESYMRLARQVRKCLHAYGIHSSTIQPEFIPGSDLEESPSRPESQGQTSPNKAPSRAESVRSDSACLLECGEECERGGQCCPK